MDRPLFWSCVCLLVALAVAAVGCGTKGFEDPLTARGGKKGFEDPLTARGGKKGFEDPLTARGGKKGFEDPLTALAWMSGATQPPASLTARERASLAAIAQMLQRGDSKAASARWERFVRASRGKKRAELDAAMLWTLRRAYLEPNAQLRQVAQQARHIHIAESALTERSAALLKAAAKAQGNTRVPVRTFRTLPRFKRGEIARIAWQTRRLNRSELASETAEVKTQQEQIRRQRRQCAGSFQNSDQKAKQLYDLMSSVMKAMNEMRMGTVRNML